MFNSMKYIIITKLLTAACFSKKEYKNLFYPNEVHYLCVVLTVAPVPKIDEDTVWKHFVGYEVYRWAVGVLHALGQTFD